jgi:phosphonoacetaldehyde hydrolase
MKLAGVILDWAGTIVDHGSRAPVETLRVIFENAGVPIEIAEARASMGLAKRTHIAAILELPRVRASWRDKHGALPSVADADALYAQFLPRQLAGLEHHSEVIQGVPQAAERMRSRGMVIGSTTGYTRLMLRYLLARAADQGFQPDVSVCPDDVPQGRPAPWMCYRNAMELNIYPLWGMVKIGDTPVDIEEGLNAGMWTVGITRTGNEVGLTAEEWENLFHPERLPLLAVAEQRLLAAGAHYTAGSLSECDSILDEIQSRLDRGEGPWNAVNTADPHA